MGKEASMQVSVPLYLILTKTIYFSLSFHQNKAMLLSIENQHCTEPQMLVYPKTKRKATKWISVLIHLTIP